MDKQVIRTSKAPQAVGAYNQGICIEGAQRTLYCSGQIALCPERGIMVGEGDVEAQARQALQNLGAVLEAGGMSFDHVVRATIYLVDMQDFGSVNQIYAEFLGSSAPARACVAVKALPKGALFEVDAIAVA